MTCPIGGCDFCLNETACAALDCPLRTDDPAGAELEAKAEAVRLRARVAADRDAARLRAAIGPPGTSTEVRITNEATGGEKGQKLARFDLLPAGPLWQVAEHYGKGAAKYEPNNWRRGYAWSLSFGALMRHAWAFWSGEDIDPETGSPHMAAVAFHALALIEFGRTHPELDDRPTAAA